MSEGFSSIVDKQIIGNNFTTPIHVICKHYKY